MEFLDEKSYNETVEYILNKIDKKDFKTDAKYEILAQKLESYVYSEVKKGNFKMHFQPKYEANEKTTKSAETLFRMKNPAAQNPYAIIHPEVAFYLFKQNGHEKDVVLKQVEMICKDMKNSDITYAEPNFKTSFNVALDCLDKEFISKVKTCLKENRLQPKNLEIEILETEDFSKIETKKEIINELQSMGISFALDDFGSRNAKGEDVLKKLNFSEVKIDKGLLDEAKQTGNYDNLKEQYNLIKKNLPKADIVLEGVDGIFDKETKKYTLDVKEVLKELRKIGPMKYQGYGFKKPMPANELGDLLKEQNGLSIGAMGE